MTEEQIKYMVDRFLNYKLPENWKPDGGITFEKFGNKGTPHQYERFPVGTNLLDADQTTAMVRHMIDGLPPRKHYQKVMTPEEYAEMPIIGWHEVCRDADGFGGVGVRFLSDLP